MGHRFAALICLLLLTGITLGQQDANRSDVSNPFSKGAAGENVGRDVEAGRNDAEEFIPEEEPAAGSVQATPGQRPTQTAPARRVTAYQVASFTRLLKAKRFDDAQRVLAALQKEAAGDPVLLLMEDQLRLVRETFDPRGSLVSIAYNVADLVVPVPRMADVSLFNREARGVRPANLIVPRTGIEPKEPAVTQADVQRLITLIHETIEPDSWRHNGGAGLIHPHMENLSLVVYQTRAVQEQVADLLNDLRAGLDRQTTLEMRLITVPAKDADAIGTAEPNARIVQGGTPQNDTQNSAIWHNDDVRTFVLAAQKSPRMNNAQLPKVTLFQEQIIRVTAGTDIAGGTDPLSMLIRPEIDFEQNTTRLRIALNRVSSEAVFASTQEQNVPSGSSWVIDLDKLRSDAQVNSPLHVVPDAAPEGTRHYLIVTPQIIVAGAEETEPRIVRASATQTRDQERTSPRPWAPVETPLPEPNANRPDERQAVPAVPVPVPEPSDDGNLPGERREAIAREPEAIPEL